MLFRSRLKIEEAYSSKYGIRCDRKKSPDCDKYRSDIDSAIIIEFTQAAGRGLHVCTPDFMYLRSEDQKIEQKIAFSDTLGVTNVLDHQYNSILRGAMCQPIHCTNISYSNEVRIDASLYHDRIIQVVRSFPLLIFHISQNEF